MPGPRMPHNNRMSSSVSLKTNDMWSKTIGHNPYAAADDAESNEKQEELAAQSASLMLLAKMTNLSGVESRGGCKKCGMLGHLTFQCRNEVKPVAEEESDSDSSSDEEGSVSSQPPRSSRDETGVSGLSSGSKKRPLEEDSKRDRETDRDAAKRESKAREKEDKKKRKKEDKKEEKREKKEKKKEKKKEREKEKRKKEKDKGKDERKSKRSKHDD